MLLRVTRLTMTFSSRTAKDFMEASTVSSVLSVNAPVDDLVKSFRSCSSRHSSSCRMRSLPVTFVAVLYSCHLVKKYSQSSEVPAGRMIGRFTFSALAEGPAAVWLFRAGESILKVEGPNSKCLRRRHHGWRRRAEKIFEF